MARKVPILGWDLVVGAFVALAALALAIYVSIPLLISVDSRPQLANLKVVAAALPGGEEAFQRHVSSESFPPQITTIPALSRTERDKPVVFALDVPANLTRGPLTIEIANIRGTQIRVWLVPSVVDSQSNDATAARELDFREAKRGIAIALPDQSNMVASRIYGIARPDRIARLSASIWDPFQFEESIRVFDQRGAALIGGFLLISLFSAALAALNRDIAFLIFSGWSITTLRLITSTGGWDTSWLGLSLSTWSANAVVRSGLVAHALLTVLLFATLFTPQIGNRNRIALAAISSVYVLIGLTGPWVPSTFFLPVFWSFCSAVMTYLVYLSARMAIYNRSPVTAWYLLSWICFFAGPVAEILLSSGLVAQLPSWLNLQTGGMAAAMVIAIALAERMRIDRSERMKAQAQAIAAGEQLAAHYRSMPIGLFTLSSDGRIRTFNPAFGDMFDLSTEGNGAAALTFRDLLNSPEVEKQELLARSARAPTPPIEFRSDSLGGRSFQLNLIARDGSLDGAIQDITARVTAEASLARLVDHDMQTKALNQRGLDQAVRKAIDLCGEGLSCAMIDVDVDRFKTLNDLYGHLVGDQLLNAACDRLLAIARNGDEVARIGDSFKVVMFNCDADLASQVAKQMHQALSSKPFEVAGRVLSVTASIGLVPIESTMDVRDAIAASSQACADAKMKGRNRVVHLGKQDMALRGYLEELKVQANLQDKINSQRFFLEFQPIVSFRSAFETLNYEVLVRMRGENGATISPGRFIPAAERNGQMSMIDHWVLMTTLRWLDDHRDHLKRLGYATINLSGSSLNDARFVDNIFAMISDFPSVMTKLCFEITETVALADRNATRRFSERVHSLGSKIALDDFGAGYTSFTYLREIEADIIKIDGSFVRDINQNPANHAITRMIVDLSHELGKHCVAEWAEHPDVIATLMQLGVDYGQGYALARPLSPESLIFAGSCGDLVTEPSVRALLKGSMSPEQVAANPNWGSRQPALF